MKKIIDTNILLNHPEIILTEDCIIPSTVIAELENIKTSLKAEEVRFQARQATRLLSSNEDKYTVHIVTNETYDIVRERDLPIDNDNLIIASCLETGEPVVFVSNDLCARLIAKDIFKLTVERYNTDKNKDAYKGYIEIDVAQSERDEIFQNLDKNTYGCLLNQYLIIKVNGEPSDVLKWNGSYLVSLSYKTIKSSKLDDTKPLDVYQECAFDSVFNNEITVLTGRAGAGKTTIPLSYFVKNLETQKIKKLYIVYHFEPLKGSRVLGFEKGDHTTKLLMSGSLGNLLASKFGSIIEVERMIMDGKLEIVPTANIRGVEFEKDSAVFVTECQDIDKYTLKTIIQRCKSGCKQIYEGDTVEQSDLIGREVGLDRMIDVFKGCEKFGYIKLKNNYRNEIGNLADMM